MDSVLKNMSDKKIKLVLFFTYGMSLKRWSESAILQRELHYYRMLAGHNIDIVFVTYGDETEHCYLDDIRESITVVPVYEHIRKPRTRTVRFFHSFHLAKHLTEYIEDSDILKTNQMWGGWVAAAVKKLIRKPLIVRCGYERYASAVARKAPLWLRWFTYFISRSVYKAADAVMLTTEKDAEFVSGHFGIKRSEIYLFPNSVDTKRFIPADKKVYKDRILFIGRLVKVKNLPILIEALKGTDIKLDIFGNGPEKETLLALAERVNVKIKISDPIPNDELPDVYRKYPLFVLPSKYEGNPKVLLEAMSCGIAVVGSDISGISAVVRNGETGMLFPADNSCELRRIITELMENCELRRKLASNAREKICSEFSMEQRITQELKLLIQNTSFLTANEHE